ncbi:MAG TPA: hypothetical protein VJR06_09575 [Nitrososphaerales archaeon]|nr:hypothetical protein [Nitrososphaerales archaeon]
MNAREKLMQALGQECVRCGQTDPDILQLDHIMDDGPDDLRRFHGGNTSMYLFYSKDIPHARTKLQILCANCNWKKRAERQRDERKALSRGAFLSILHQPITEPLQRSKIRLLNNEDLEFLLNIIGYWMDALEKEIQRRRDSKGLQKP